MAFVTDSFTDTAGTTLDAHTGETGATWTQRTAANVHVITDANRLRCNVASGGRYTASGTPATAEYDITADFVVFTVTGGMGFVGRYNTADGTHYQFSYATGAGRWELYRIQGGNNLLGSYAQTLSTSTTYVVKLELRNASKKVYIDGVQRIESPDNNLTAAGLAGVIAFTAVTNSTGYHLDNFDASDPAAAPGSPHHKRLGGVMHQTALAGIGRRVW